jgi:hypothetical protein
MNWDRHMYLGEMPSSGKRGIETSNLRHTYHEFQTTAPYSGISVLLITSSM